MVLTHIRMFDALNSFIMCLYRCAHHIKTFAELKCQIKFPAAK